MACFTCDMLFTMTNKIRAENASPLSSSSSVFPFNKACKHLTIFFDFSTPSLVVNVDSLNVSKSSGKWRFFERELFFCGNKIIFENWCIMKNNKSHCTKKYIHGMPKNSLSCFLLSDYETF